MLIKGFPLPEFDFEEEEDSASECEEPPILPILEDSESINRISSETLVSVLDNKYSNKYDKLFIIDCRFWYEYDGGHIKGALNINNPQKLIEKFFENNIYKNSLIVFHCEFSHNRGPQIAELFRGYDRRIHKESYPSLTYNQVYILDKGYREFYSKYSNYCVGGFVSMVDKDNQLNGNLSSATNKFNEGIEDFEKNYKGIIKDIPNVLTSPAGYPLRSPMSNKMLALHLSLD